jgi:hypothetical protein
MKYNKEASEKTVETSIIAAPPTSGQVRTQHIPPIEIIPGSVILETHHESVGDNMPSTNVPGYPKKHVFTRSKKIKYVRVIMFNGSHTSVIDAEYPSSQGGNIGIWVSSTPEPNMVIKTGAGTDELLQLEIDNDRHEFGAVSIGGTTSHQTQRRKYNDPAARLSKVRLSGVGGSPDQVSTHQIVLIQIWPE